MKDEQEAHPQLVPERVIGLIEVRATNRTTEEYVAMAFYEEETGIARIRFDHHDHRLRMNDTYNIQDDVMGELDRLGCRVIRIQEVNCPDHCDAEYDVDFAEWHAEGTTDYGFGAGLQYPMARDRVRQNRVA